MYCHIAHINCGDDISMSKYHGLSSESRTTIVDPQQQTVPTRFDCRSKQAACRSIGLVPKVGSPWLNA